jgi:hypothetical protein
MSLNVRISLPAMKRRGGFYWQDGFLFLGLSFASSIAHFCFGWITCRSSDLRSILRTRNDMSFQEPAGRSRIWFDLYDQTRCGNAHKPPGSSRDSDINASGFKSRCAAVGEIYK